MQNKKESILITLHGIGTYGMWQKDFFSMIEAHSSAFKHYTMPYGRVSPLRVALPYLRKRIEKEVHIYLQKIMQDNKHKDIHIIAHSFGTYLILKYLVKNPTYKNIKTIILTGSVLAPNYLKKQSIKHKLDFLDTIETFINECGISDKNLLMSKLFALNFSDAGRKGLVIPKNSKITNRYFQGGHKVCFNKTFYKHNWLPHVLGETNIHSIDERINSYTLRLLELFYILLSKFKYVLFALIFIPVIIYTLLM